MLLPSLSWRARVLGGHEPRVRVERATRCQHHGRVTWPVSRRSAGVGGSGVTRQVHGADRVTAAEVSLLSNVVWAAGGMWGLY